MVETTAESITARFIFEQFERLSFKLRRLTAMVVDNAPAHERELSKSESRCGNGRFVHLLLTAIFAAPEYRKDVMAKAEIRMASAERL